MLNDQLPKLKLQITVVSPNDFAMRPSRIVASVCWKPSTTMPRSRKVSCKFCKVSKSGTNFWLWTERDRTKKIDLEHSYDVIYILLRLNPVTVARMAILQNTTDVSLLVLLSRSEMFRISERWVLTLSSLAAIPLKSFQRVLTLEYFSSAIT